MKRIAGLSLVVVLAGGCGSGAATTREGAVTSTSSARPVPARACPAPSLVVTSTSEERLHAGWLPTGLRLTSPSESGLGAQGGVDYFDLGGSDPPFVVLRRFLSNEDPARLVEPPVGNTQPIEVQGHAGAFTDAAPGPPPTFGIGWTIAPGVQIEVQAHGLTKADAMRVANSVQYTPGRPFTYPTRPPVRVTRARALAVLGGAPAAAHAVLSSFGEFTSMRARDANHESSIATDVPVTQPVWVAWAATSGDPAPVPAVVVDARSGATIVTLPAVDPRVLAALSDRSAPGCAPPFGVLTRAEVTSLEPPASGGHVGLRLTTEGRVRALPGLGALLNCPIQHCDPTVPVWLRILTAPDHRYLRVGLRLGVTGLAGPSGTTTTLPAGSWQLSLFDARTGPQDTSMGNGAYSSAGRPPAALLALADLAPD